MLSRTESGRKMSVLIIVLLVSLIIFLFSIHALSSDDVVLLRKNIQMEKIFNMAIYTILFGMFISRVVFIADNFDPAFLNPLVFLLFTYFPGLSLVGSVLGGGTFLTFQAKRKKYPVGRLLDVFSLAGLSSLAVGLVSYGLLTNTQRIPNILAALTFFWVFLALYKLFIKSAFRDGSLALISFSFFSFIAIILRVIEFFHNPQQLLSLETVLLAAFFLATLVFLVRFENLLSYFPKVMRVKR